MSSTPIRVFAGEVPFATTTFYAAPIGFTVVVTSIVIANTASGSRQYYMGKSSEATIVPNLTIGPNDSLALDVSFALPAGGSLRHAASLSDSLHVYISGLISA